MWKNVENVKEERMNWNNHFETTTMENISCRGVSTWSGPMHQHLLVTVVKSVSIANIVNIVNIVSNGDFVSIESSTLSMLSTLSQRQRQRQRQRPTPTRFFPYEVLIQQNNSTLGSVENGNVCFSTLRMPNVYRAKFKTFTSKMRKISYSGRWMLFGMKTLFE